MTRAEAATSGRMWKGIRALTISLVIVTGTMTIVMFTRNAAALTVDYYDLNGYQGNSVVYMTTGITDTATAPVITTLYSHVSLKKSSNWEGVANALNLSIGQPRNPIPGKAVFAYYYQAFAPAHLIINVPIAAAGGADFLDYYPTALYSVFELTTTLTQSGAPTVTAQFKTQYNSGMNVTVPGTPGNTLDENLWNLAIDAAGFLPGVGFAISAGQVMYDLMMLTGTSACGGEPYLTGDGSMCQWFHVNPDHNKDKNVFTAQTYVEIDIPPSSFMTIRPTFTISAQNWIGDDVVDANSGANPSVSFGAVPAVTITGTVSAAGSPLANQDIVLSTYTEGPYVSINYHLKTNQNGVYRFFAPLNAPYTLSAIYQTSFGSASAQTSFTTLSTPDSQTVDLQLPVSKLYGYVKNSGGSPIGGAAVATTSPSGTTFTTSSAADGSYSLTVKDTGTYSLTASAPGYNAQTRTQTVSAFNTAYHVTDFALSSGSSTHTFILRPMANGDLVLWSKNGGGGANWDRVDDVTSDASKTYVYSTLCCREDRYQLTDLPALSPGETVLWVEVHALAMRTRSSSTVTLTLTVGGSTAGYYWYVSTSYVDYSYRWGQHPQYGAWTPALVNSLQAGILAGQVTSGQIRVTQVWIVVQTTHV